MSNTNKPAPIVRRVDELGRIVLPIELRMSAGILENTAMSITCSDGVFTLKPSNGQCIRCRGVSDGDNLLELIEVDGQSICVACLKKYTQRLNDANAHKTTE